MLSPILDADTYNPREHMGLGTNLSDESLNLLKDRIVNIIDTFNYLKLIDSKCADKNKRVPLFEGVLTIHDIYVKWLSYSLFFQMSKAASFNHKIPKDATNNNI